MSKYANVRIEAVQDCPSCTVVVDSCRTCGGTGEVRTPLLLPGEPFFLVRGKDELAEQIVAVYGVLFARAHGRRVNDWPQDLEDRLAAIVEWQDANPGLVKRPD